METLGAERSAWIALSGNPEPELFADLDGERVGRARMLEVLEINTRLINDRVNNWTVVAAPNEGWARAVFGEPDFERLWRAVEVTASSGVDVVRAQHASDDGGAYLGEVALVDGTSRVGQTGAAASQRRVAARESVPDMTKGERWRKSP